MTEWLEYSSEWGYWINPDTFFTPRIKKSIRVGAVFFEKSREILDDGRQVIVTTYGVARSDRAEEMGKREVSDVLARQMVDYMRAKKSYPPKTFHKKTYKNGNVDMSYEPSDYDKFTITLTPSFVGGNVEDFLDSLSGFEERPKAEDMAWKIEPAKSDRSSCRTCSSSIEKGELRLGEPDEFEGHISYRWHHLKCQARALKWMALDELEGYSDLTDEQRSEVNSIKD